MWRHCVAEPARPGPGLLLRPALTNVDNYFDCLVHILDRYPFQPRVEVLFSSKQIRCRKAHERQAGTIRDRKSTRLNSSHSQISYAVFCLKKKKQYTRES